ncbi:MAG: hypothetical protein ABIF11_04455 [Nitrospirota bacterium]
MENQLLVEKMKRCQEDSLWIVEHYDELKKRYPYEGVAVINKQVIAHHKDSMALGRQLREKYGKEAGHIAVEFIVPKEMVLVV